MSKPTPGPWFYHEPINSKRKDFGVTAGRPYDPSVGAVRRIAWVGNSVHHNPDLQDEVRSNARLIAAAPDMLAALEAITKRYVDLAGSGDCGNWNPEEEPEVIAARSALRSALSAQEPEHDRD